MKCAQAAEVSQQKQSSNVLSNANNDDDELDSENELVEASVKTQLGRYSDAVHFRDGLFSAVYRASSIGKSLLPGFEGEDNGLVAIKVTAPSQEQPPHDSRREALLLEHLNSHYTGYTPPSTIIPLIEILSLSSGRFGLVFPFCRYSLAELLHPSSSARLCSLAELIPHLQSLFQALEFVHSQGIIHRDVKPSNILLFSRHGPAVLTDFGIAWAPEALQIAARQSEPANDKMTDVGTTHYRPPELLFGCTTYDSSLDMWAAGCVVAECGLCCREARFSTNYEGQGRRRDSLFDSGDLGSELALVKSQFETLGTPSLENWPSAAALPDWGKMQFKQFETRLWHEILPGTSPGYDNRIGQMFADIQDLCSRLLRFEQTWRMSANEAFEHEFFTHSWLDTSAIK